MPTGEEQVPILFLQVMASAIGSAMPDQVAGCGVQGVQDAVALLKGFPGPSFDRSDVHHVVDDNGGGKYPGPEALSWSPQQSRIVNPAQLPGCGVQRIPLPPEPTYTVSPTTVGGVSMVSGA